MQYSVLEILADGPLGLFTSSFAAFGRLSRLTHAPHPTGNSQKIGKYRGHLVTYILSECFEKSSGPYLRNTSLDEVTWIFGHGEQ